jgi:LacI family transcriptional regulator
MESTNAGSNTPTIYDVAERAGVSIATVSRALNGHDYMRPATRELVLQAVRDLRFVPNGAARGLSSGSKKVLGLLFVRLPPPNDLLEVEQESLLFTDSVIRGAELSAHNQGYSLLLGGVDDDGRDRTAINALISKCDGLIMLDRTVPERRVSAVAKRIPTVLLAGSGRSRSAVTVRVDNSGAMHQMAEHLCLVHGLKRWAFLSGFANSPDSVTRFEGFAAGAAEFGAQIEDDAVWTSDYTSVGAVNVIRKRMAGGKALPQAIACANDQAAIGAVYGLQQAGIRVPEDIAVTGFDDISVSRHVSPPLTTVRQPSQQLGSAAVDALLNLVDGKGDDPTDVVLPTRVVIRASCGCRP